MYLVTGGAGFIGSNIVAALASRGDAVVVSDRLYTDERWRNLAKHELADIVAPPRLPDWLSLHEGQVQAIIHVGAISATTESDVDLIYENNIRLSLDLWNWCTSTGTRFIYASSAATYGDGSEGFDDDARPEALARLRPLNAYGWGKHVVDRRIARLAQTGGMLPPQWVGLKFFNVYGPNEYHKGGMKSIIAHNGARVAAGETMRLFRSYRPDYPDGGQLRDFIYVRDCVDVTMWFLDNPHICGLFNLGTGKARSWLDLAHAMFAAVEREPQLEFIEMTEPLRSKYQYYTQAAIGRLRAVGYERPFTALEDGVRDYMQNYLLATDPYY